MKVKIEKYDDEARGITRIDGKVTFVPKAIPEEIVEVTLIKEEKKFNEAKLDRVVVPSLNRIEPLCSYFDSCGGCDLLHVSCEDSLKIKKEQIENVMKKILKLDTNIEIISKSNFNYRNKITLKIINGIIGYYKANSHELVEIDNCLNAKKSINDFIKYLKLLNIDHGEVTIRSNYNDEILVIIKTDEKISINDEFLNTNCKLLGVIINDNCVYGNDKYVEKIGKYFFDVSYDSFFQINNEICLDIFELIENCVRGKSILDLYCGVGTLGIVASKHAESVMGVEIVPNAIKNALTNAKMNKRDNISYLLGNANSIGNKINKKFDVIIVDPPRSGLDKNTVKYLMDSGSKSIIYISCNPKTLARDLNVLKDKYDIEFIKALDMFPNTKHIECIVLLNQK